MAIVKDRLIGTADMKKPPPNIDYDTDFGKAVQYDAAADKAGANDDKLDYKAPEVKPVTTEVDAPNETVEGRMSSINLRDSAYSTLNEKEAIAQANSRGLINSTMAGAAGVEAGIKASLPIAQQDAKTYTDTRFNNQADTNRFLENRQSTNLNMESDAFRSELAQDEAAFSNQLAIDRDNNSAALNESLARLESELKSSEMTLDASLKTKMEQTLASDDFSDEAKMSIVNTMADITRDAQQQITAISTSDRSSKAQASAIELIQENRDASLATYQTLLDSMEGWDWSTDFTPEDVLPGGASEADAASTQTALDADEQRRQDALDWSAYLRGAGER